MRKFALIVLLVILMPVQAQDDSIHVSWNVPFEQTTPITIENAIGLQRAGTIGTGSTLHRAWSSDGRWLAQAGSAGIWIYDGDDWTNPPRLIESDSGAVTQIAFSGDDTILIGTCGGFIVCAWQFASGQLLLTVSTEAPYPPGIIPSRFVISPDDRYLVVYSTTNRDGATETAQAVLFEIEAAQGQFRSQQIRIFDGMIDSLVPYTFTPDSTALLILTAQPHEFSYNYRLYAGTFYDVRTGEETATPYASFLNAALFSAIEYTADGKYSLISREDAFVMVNTQTGNLVFTIPSSGRGHRVALSPDSTRLTVSLVSRVEERYSYDVQVWDIEAGSRFPVFSLALTHDERIVDLAFTGNSDSLVILMRLPAVDSGQRGTGVLQLRNAITGELLDAFDLDVPALAVDMRPGSDVAATTYYDSVTLTSLITGAAHTIQDDVMTVYKLVFHRPEYLTAAQGYQCSEIDLQQQAVVNRFGCNRAIFAFHPSAQWLVTTSFNNDWAGSVGKQYLPENQFVGRILRHNGGLRSLDMHPGGHQFVTAAGSPSLSGENSVIRAWDFDTLEFIRAFGDTYDWISQVLYSPDGSWLVSAHSNIDSNCSDAVIQLWNPNRNYELVMKLAGYTSPLLFTPDSRYLVAQQLTPESTCRPSGQITLLDVATGEIVSQIPESVASIAISPNGQLLAGGTPAGEIVLWDITAGREIMRRPAHRESVEALAFNTSGTLLASASYAEDSYTNWTEKVIKLWGVSDG